MNKFDDLRKNGSGYMDLTAYHAIMHVLKEQSNDEIMLNNFEKDLKKLLNKYQLKAVGEIQIKYKNKYRNLV